MARQTTTVIICDRCKKTMAYTPYKRQVCSFKRAFRKMTKVELEDPNVNSWYNIQSAELCGDCAKALDKWLNTPPVEDKV